LKESWCNVIVFPLSFSLHADVNGPPCREHKGAFLHAMVQAALQDRPASDRRTKDAFPKMSLLPKRSTGFIFKESGTRWRRSHSVGVVLNNQYRGYCSPANLAKFIVVFTIAVGLD
jgi:hypothetical protein